MSVGVGPDSRHSVREAWGQSKAVGQQGIGPYVGVGPVQKA